MHRPFSYLAKSLALMAGATSVLTSCSLLFDATEPDPAVADGGRIDARVMDAAVAPDGAITGDVSSKVNCGSMKPLHFVDFAGLDFSANWDLLSPLDDAFELVGQDLHAHVEKFASPPQSRGIISKGAIQAPYALDIHVSDIASAGNSQFLLKFQYEDDQNYLQVAVTATAVNIDTADTSGIGEPEHETRPRLSSDSTDYFLRLVQDNDLVEVHHSMDGLEWFMAHTFPAADRPAFARVAARVNTTVMVVQPPMILHSIGSTCE